MGISSWRLWTVVLVNVVVGEAQRSRRRIRILSSTVAPFYRKLDVADSLSELR